VNALENVTTGLTPVPLSLMPKKLRVPVIQAGLL